MVDVAVSGNRTNDFKMEPLKLDPSVHVPKEHPDLDRMHAQLTENHKDPTWKGHDAERLELPDLQEVT
eukprot:UN13469